MTPDQANNPHPDAFCEYCGCTKWNVKHEACSMLCAEILGVSAQGLPTAKEKERAGFRAMGWRP